MLCAKKLSSKWFPNSKFTSNVPRSSHRRERLEWNDNNNDGMDNKRREGGERKKEAFNGELKLNWKFANCKGSRGPRFQAILPFTGWGRVKRTFRTRLENKAGTMERNESWRTNAWPFKWRDPREKVPRGGPTGSFELRQESLYRTHD